MTSALHFYALAIMVGMVQGGTQALSRSLFASMIPRHKSSEFFAFFGVFERYAGILGPLVFAAMVDATGQSRNAMLAVLGFFVIGAAILVFVDVDAGRRAARQAEAPSRLTMATRSNPAVRWLAKAVCRIFYRADCIGSIPPPGCGAASAQPSECLARSRARLGDGRPRRALPRQVDALRRLVRTGAARRRRDSGLSQDGSWRGHRPGTSRRSLPCQPHSPPGTPSASFRKESVTPPAASSRSGRAPRA